MSKKLFFLLVFVTVTLTLTQFATADYRITNERATESVWVVYSTFRPADRNWPAGWWTTGYLKILPEATRTLPIPANNNSVYIRIVERDGKEIKPTDHATRKPFRFSIHPSKNFRVVLDKNGRILKSSHNTWTLKHATLYRYRNGGSHTIPSNEINSNDLNIGLQLPSDLISEEAFARDSIYFVLKAQHPTLTGGSGLRYGSCQILLDVPPDREIFIFPIPSQTKTEEARDAAKGIAVTLLTDLIRIPIPLGGTLLGVLDLFSKVRDAKDEQNYKLRIELQNWVYDRQRPEKEVNYLVLLRQKLGVRNALRGINITMEQQYLTPNGTRPQTIKDSKFWRFEEGWAAPTAQPVPIFDYPPFQLLPAEVQQYLLLQFSELGTTESGLIPEETALLANYPNPFNPETWIPYHLANASDVKITIYDTRGGIVRQLALGHQPAGFYNSRSRAAYWDGRNRVGEPVASGVYFYQLETDDLSSLRKMVILK